MVHWWFRRFARLLLFRTIRDLAVMLDCKQSGREGGRSRARLVL
jgi:putative transposase